MHTFRSGLSTESRHAHGVHNGQASHFRPGSFIPRQLSRLLIRHHHLEVLEDSHEQIPTHTLKVFSGTFSNHFHILFEEFRFLGLLLQNSFIGYI